MRGDPAGIYPRMDSGSRDAYRQVVERLARRSPLTVEEVARRAVQHAQQASEGTENLAGHVGYYLVDAGRTTLEESIGYRRPWKEALAGLAARRLLGLVSSAASRWSRSWRSRPPSPLCSGGWGRSGGPGLRAAAGALGGHRHAILAPDGQPVLHLDRAAAAVGADGFFPGIPPQCRTLVAIPDARQPPGHRRACPGAPVALPRQPRRESAVCLGHRFSRCPAEDNATGPPAAPRGPHGRSGGSTTFIAEREHRSSSSCTARGNGIRKRACGWARSGNAANWLT